MAEVMMMIIDNSFSSQNQDYIPNRFIVQLDAAKALVTKKLQDSPENEIGICPLCVQDFNVMTPNNIKNNINQFVSKIRLCDENPDFCVVQLCIKAMTLKQQKTKTILIFLGSQIKNPDRMWSAINDALSVDFIVKLCFFGDGIQYSELFENNIYGNNYSYCIVATDEDVYGSAMNLLGENEEEMDDDPELAMAIKMSLEEQARNK